MISFENKKVAILGFGMEGRDIFDFVMSNKARITVFDRKKMAELGEIPASTSMLEFSLGNNYLKRGLAGFDYIFCSPGIRRDMLEILEAKKHGALVSSATKLFFDLCPAKIIGITGTKGKGTTATIIHEILVAAGRKSFLAGNIGRPMLSSLPGLDKNSWAVLELSSFQLQDLEKSPHIAVALFITSEHLDYHANTEEYVLAKSQIARHQKEDDFIVLNADDATSSSFSALTKAQVFCFSRSKKTNGCFVDNGRIILRGGEIGETKNLKLRGEHNWDNVCAAATVGYLATGDIEAIKKAIFSFSGLEHRLEFIAEINGIKFYNDSFSTTPETTIAAIKSFSEPIVLIAGGSDKGSDFSELGRQIAGSNIRVLVLIGKMATKIRDASLAGGYKGKIIFQPGEMDAAVAAAVDSSESGWIILLSPACASFDMFTNYKDRGKQFKANVEARKKKE